MYGSYANAEAHAGIVRSSSAQVVTNGPVSLAFAGKGRGVDLGIAFGKLTITPVATRSHEPSSLNRSSTRISFIPASPQVAVFDHLACHPIRDTLPRGSVRADLFAAELRRVS